MRRFNKLFIGVTLFCIITSAAAANEADKKLLERTDSLASYMNTDFSAEYRIVQEKPGQSRTSTTTAVFRRDSQEMYVIVVLEPTVSKGQGYLKQGKTLWFYDPESRRFNSTSSQSRFQNTNARNSDFTRSTLALDYRIVSGENAQLGRFSCRVLTLEAVTNEVTYPRMKIWISEDGLVRKTEDYSLSGQILRTSAIPDYHQIGQRFVPKSIVFVDELRGTVIDGNFVKERTLVTISRPSFAKVADSVFSKSYLETVNR